MARLVKGAATTAGLTPGTPVHVGERKSEQTRLFLCTYEESGSREIEAATVEEAVQLEAEPGVAWIDVRGIHDVAVIEKLGQRFNLHPLILEDIMNTDQRPKLEDYGDYLFLVFKDLSYDSGTHRISLSQVSIVLGKDFVVSFQEGPEDSFAAVRERIRNGKGRIRRMGPDYLVYSLLDAAVDNYFTVIERVGEEIEYVEDELTLAVKRTTLRAIHRLKIESLMLRKSIWPLRDVVVGLERGGSEFVKESTSLYLMDLHDHVLQAVDTVETYRDMVTGMVDIYLSSVSNKMNEIMKVLTIIATIFIPLTWIAGIYGMNFEYMPELKQWWGYPAVLAFMIFLGVSMMVYFKKRKWF
jgi:magnesium transporter